MSKQEKDFETNKKPPTNLVVEKPVKEPLPETPVEVKPTPELIPEVENTPLVLVSESDAYINDRMKSQPKTLEEVALLQPKTYGPGKHRLSLPDELLEYDKEFAFRWVLKKKRSIDDATDVKGWIFVNRALFSKLPKHLFTTTGAMERGDAVLMFMSLKKVKALRQTPIEKAKALRSGNPMLTKEKLPDVEKGQAGFYTPSPESSKSEGGDFVMKD